MPDSYRDWLYGSYRSGFKGQVTSTDLDRLDELYGRFLQPLPADVLELGAGTGDIIDWLHSRGVANAWGIDHSPEQVEAAHAMGRRVECMDIVEALAAQADGSLDGMVAIDVLEHLNRDQLVVVAQEAGRVLRSGGRFLVQVPNGQALRPGPIWAADLTHETLLSEPSLRQLFAPAGLEMESTWGITPGYGKWMRTVRTLIWKTVSLTATLLDLIESGQRLSVYERVLAAIFRKSR